MRREHPLSPLPARSWAPAPSGPRPCPSVLQLSASSLAVGTLEQWPGRQTEGVMTSVPS